MPIKAIAFGSIGTIIETSEIQRAAFNQAFKEHQLEWHWSRDNYIDMLKSSGGQERIAEFAESQGENVDAKAIHATKTKIFNQMLDEDGAPVRDGVLDVIDHAKHHDIALGFATTTGETNVQSCLKVLAKHGYADVFSFVGNRDMVESSKPSADIYHSTLKSLGVKPEDTIAVEDTAVSMQSALAAGISCIAFPGENTSDQNFEGARVVTKSLNPSQFY